MSFANNIENKNELLGGKKLKVKYIPGGNFMQMSASEESCEDTSWGSGGFFKLEKSVIAALNVADDIAVLEEFILGNEQCLTQENFSRSTAPKWVPI